MIPILLDIPHTIETPRLILKRPEPGLGKAVNDAILESYDELHKWMPWADHKPTVEETEWHMRTSYAKWILREDLAMLIFEKQSKKFLGSTGLHRMNWQVGHFEIGYWIRSSYTNQGVITESTNALTRFAFEELKANRVEIKCDETNAASRRVAEKLLFNLEGTLLKNRFKANSQELSNTVIYARYDLKDLPALDVSW